MEKEDILAEKPDGYALFPIQYQNLWDLYKKGRMADWIVEEVSLEKDLSDWTYKLNDDERRCLSYTLAFFSSSDIIVMDNLAKRFMDEVTILEAKMFYAYQISNESVHSEMYALLIVTLIKDENERLKLLSAISTIDTIREKAKWANNWITNAKDYTFPTRLVAFACVEGIFFSSSFCMIYWFKKRGLLDGVVYSNELISRDEGLHCEFACELYKTLKYSKLRQMEVEDIVKSAITIEKKFAIESIKVNLLGMNSELMSNYIEFVADVLMTNLGLDKIYKTKNPFSFMDIISLDGKSNFFERKVPEYKKDDHMRTIKYDKEDFNNKDF